MAQFPLQLELRHSFFLRRLVWLLHLTVAAGLLAVPWPVLPRLFLTLLVLLSLWHTEQRGVQKTPPLRISLRRGGEARYWCADSASWRELVIQASAWVHPWGFAVSLRFADGHSEARWLLADCFSSPETFRQFRVWVRWEAGKPSPAAISHRVGA